jgi:hypothetical protein
MSPRDHLNAQLAADREAGLSEDQALANFAISRARTLDHDTPAKRWFYADLDRAPIYRALRLDPADKIAMYASAPFRISRDENDAWRILAAWPCPAIYEPEPDWLGIREVVCWNPLDDTATVVGHNGTGGHGRPDVAALIGAFGEGADEIHAGPRAFFQAWAIRRAHYAGLRASTKAHWQVPPKERDETPGVLIIGDVAGMQWNLATMPARPICYGVDPLAVHRSILKSANLPRAAAAPQSVRVAA